MSRNLKIGIGIGVTALIGLVVVLALVIANLGAIATWIGFDAAGNLNGREGAIGLLLNPEARVNNVVQCADDPGCAALWPIIFAAGFAFVFVTGFAYTTLLERRLLAFLQHRVGPNRVGPLGFMQPAADGVKLVFKEDLMPAGADKWVFRLAPMIKVIPILMIAAVIPMGPDLVLPWFAPSLGDVWYQVPQGLLDSNVGILWVIAITSIATYGVVLAGWSSDNKYAMLGALRASAQMISYELSFALTLAVPVMIVGSMAIGDIIDAQRNIWDWFVFQNPLAAAVLFLALLAETNRAPFDLTEAEQELTQGYMTEYSGMKFALFMMAEYLGMIAVSLVAVAVFFGGYHLWPMDGLPVLAPVIFILKVVLMLCGMIWIRATLPRIRYDRLMMFGWKVMIPLALLAVAWTAVALVIGDSVGGSAYTLVSGIVFVLALAFGAWSLRRISRDRDSEEAIPLEDDPAYTGERRGLGWALVHLVGMLIAIPLAQIRFQVRALEGLASFGRTPEEDRELQREETAIKTAGG
ncbi:MAG: NADH-quinone oxidoreductase subunit NuoH [Chloroflexi bacterium]|nr:NADH-quinone oxidoreductase subunit NuoH [Chloroflexota bacterium]